MLRKKTILVACGAGIATSTVVCDRLEELIKKNNLNAQVIQCKIGEVASKEKEADLIISTTILPKQYSIPAIRSMAYVTGIDEEKLDQEVIAILTKE
jgi:PTS system galactitol-specific IIB component